MANIPEHVAAMLGARWCRKPHFTPLASHTASNGLRLPVSDKHRLDDNDESFESFDDDQKQDAARPRSDQGDGTNVKLNDGSGGLASEENHSKTSLTSPRGSRTVSSTVHNGLERPPQARGGSSDAESEGSHSVDAGVRDAGSGAISSDDEHYNPSVSSEIFRTGQ